MVPNASASKVTEATPSLTVGVTVVVAVEPLTSGAGADGADEPPPPPPEGLLTVRVPFAKAGLAAV